ncbi:MAG: DUF2232 domain-containing protein [Thioalkalivibrionaceae bacterium]
MSPNDSNQSSPPESRGSVLAWVMQTRSRAILAIALLAALGLLLPPFGFLASAMIALVVLREGLGQGVLVASVVTLAVAIVLALLAGPGAIQQGIVIGLVQWGPVIALAAVLHRSGRLSHALLVGALTTAAGVLAVRLLVPEIEGVWVDLGGELLARFVDQDPDAAAQLTDALVAAAPYLTGFAGAMLLFSLSLGLILARYWHAVLDRPGAFGAEFRALQFGVVPSGLLVVLLLLGPLSGLAVLSELALPLAVLFFFQGLAVVHDVRHRLQAGTFWLVGVYVLLVILAPQVAVFLITLGALDAVLRLRERVQKGGRPDREE